MTTRLSVSIVVAALTLAGFPTSSAAAQERPSPPVACPSPDAPVHEERFVPVGGIEQWVTLSGERCANPVILFLHGGPGNPLSPYADVIFGSWRKDFTLVQWDQRGAGRTFGRNPPPAGSTLTVQQMTDDGVALAEYLTRHLGNAKLILVGGSWGSVLGVHMVTSRPDLFHGYVGFSQLVAAGQNQAATYAALTALAAASKDDRTTSALEAMGPPPWSNPRNFGVVRRATRVYEAKTADPAPETWWVRSAAYAPADEREHAEEGEDFSYLAFVGLDDDGMLATIDLPRLGTVFRVPVFLVQGAEDLVTMPEVTRRYFDGISAPQKELVVVPRAGHDPNRQMVDAIYELLNRQVRPLTQ